jgi:hypothetical protein
MLRKGILLLATLAACSGDGATDVTVACPGESSPRILRGVCTVDTEHTLEGIDACGGDSGVRRYTQSNSPDQTQDECRAVILDVAAEFCAKSPGEMNWQASWVVFKPDGRPSQGAEQMYGTCMPRVITRDEWATTVRKF